MLPSWSFCSILCCATPSGHHHPSFTDWDRSIAALTKFPVMMFITSHGKGRSNGGSKAVSSVSPSCSSGQVSWVSYWVS